jgi:hypothetical protein
MLCGFITYAAVRFNAEMLFALPHMYACENPNFSWLFRYQGTGLLFVAKKIALAPLSPHKNYFSSRNSTVTVNDACLIFRFSSRKSCRVSSISLVVSV